VQVIRRQLNYRDWPNQPPREKGIDVAIAVDLVHLAFRHFLDEKVWDAVADDWHGRV
jgi:hypothetical protein